MLSGNQMCDETFVSVINIKELWWWRKMECYVEYAVSICLDEVSTTEMFMDDIKLNWNGMQVSAHPSLGISHCWSGSQKINNFTLSWWNKWSVLGTAVRYISYSVIPRIYSVPGIISLTIYFYRKSWGNTIDYEVVCVVNRIISQPWLYAYR